MLRHSSSAVEPRRTLTVMLTHPPCHCPALLHTRQMSTTRTAACTCMAPATAPCLCTWSTAGRTSLCTCGSSPTGLMGRRAACWCLMRRPPQTQACTPSQVRAQAGAAHHLRLVADSNCCSSHLILPAKCMDCACVTPSAHITLLPHAHTAGGALQVRTRAASRPSWQSWCQPSQCPAWWWGSSLPWATCPVHAAHTGTSPSQPQTTTRCWTRGLARAQAAATPLQRAWWAAVSAAAAGAPWA